MRRYIILTDTGFWIALLDPQNNLEEHEKALQILKVIEEWTILVPWPTLYEFVNTRLARRPDNLKRFHIFLKKANVMFIDDALYKNSALEKTFEQTEHRYLTFSLVDNVIREMLHDPDLKLDCLLTFNDRDFADACAVRGIQILN